MKIISLKQTLQKYSDYAILNRNLIVSIASAMLVSAIFAQLAKELAVYVNAASTIAVSYSVYYVVFGTLYYKSNKKKYATETGTDKRKFREDLFKIVVSAGTAEIVYLVTRWMLHYYLLEGGQEPFAASVLAHAASASIFVLIMNVGVSLTKLYKPSSQN